MVSIASHTVQRQALAQGRRTPVRLAPARPSGGAPRARSAIACRSFALRPAQLLAAATPALLRVSHVCGSSFKQQLGDAIDALDGQRKKRIDAINKLYHAKTREELEAVLADGFTMGEAGYSRKFTKADYIGLMTTVLAAIPDFSWSEASEFELADDGYCIVVVAASGHHTGGELRLPGLDPLPASGKHFCLAEEIQKVKVDSHGKVSEIVVLPNKGAGPRAMYAALGGKLPTPAPAADSTPPMP